MIEVLGPLYRKVSPMVSCVRRSLEVSLFSEPIVAPPRSGQSTFDQTVVGLAGTQLQPNIPEPTGTVHGFSPSTSQQTSQPKRSQERPLGIRFRGRSLGNSLASACLFFADFFSCVTRASHQSASLSTFKAGSAHAHFHVASLG